DENQGVVGKSACEAADRVVTATRVQGDHHVRRRPVPGDLDFNSVAEIAQQRRPPRGGIPVAVPGARGRWCDDGDFHRTESTGALPVGLPGEDDLRIFISRRYLDCAPLCIVSQLRGSCPWSGSLVNSLLSIQY